MNETELLPMRHTIVVVNGRIVSVAAVSVMMKRHAHSRNLSNTHTRHISSMSCNYAWTLLHELSKTNNDHHHQVIFTLTTLIQIRAKELLLLSLLSHIYFE